MSVDKTSLVHLMSEGQRVRDVLLESLESRELRKGNIKEERISALLYPRKKRCSVAKSVNAVAPEQVSAEENCFKMTSDGDVIHSSCVDSRCSSCPGNQRWIPGAAEQKNETFGVRARRKDFSPKKRPTVADYVAGGDHQAERGHSTGMPMYQAEDKLPGVNGILVLEFV